MCLSDKVKSEKFSCFRGFCCQLARQKKCLTCASHCLELVERHFGCWPKKTLKFETVIAARNLTTVDIGQAKDLNVIDLLKHQYIIVTKKGVEILEKRLAK